MNFSASTFAEPLTPRGVAAFARAKLSRLLLVQLIIALLAAASVVWFLADGCFPTVLAAIQKLPVAGQIRSGRLDWRGDSPQSLAEGRLLAFDVDLNHTGKIRSTADVQFELGAETVRVISLLGHVDFGYVPDRSSPFNRIELEPRWRAWSAEILFFAFVVSALALMLIWWLLSAIYILPVWLLGLYANRDLNFRASWKLSGAALMPGALLMAAGVLLYGHGFLDLVSFGFILAAHLVLGWIYLFLSLLFLPRISMTPQKGNPFKPDKPRETR
jgi:hypothetical protein